MRLFVYGELCKVAVLREQLGHLPAATVAVAPGHRRRRATSGFYELVPDSGARAFGLLLEGLSRADVASLDRFEGVASGAYRRAEITVSTLGSEADELVANVYLAPAP